MKKCLQICSFYDKITLKWRVFPCPFDRTGDAFILSRAVRAKECGTMFFDTHAHYDDEAFDGDRAVLLDSMAAGGVGSMIRGVLPLRSVETVASTPLFSGDAPRTVTSAPSTGSAPPAVEAVTTSVPVAL